MKVEIKKELHDIYYASAITTDERFLQRAINFYENRNRYKVDKVYEEVINYKKNELLIFLSKYELLVNEHKGQKLVNLRDGLKELLYGCNMELIGLILKSEGWSWTSCSEVQLSTVLNTHPSYQRELVWSLNQKQNYILYRLRGGQDTLIFNERKIGEDLIMEVVDGQQRLNAMLDFANNKFPIKYEGKELFYKDILYPKFSIEYKRLEFQNPKDVLDFYIKFNSAGINHTEEEIKLAQDELNKLKKEA